MPVSLQQFFTNADAVNPSAALFLQNNGAAVGNTSQLHGLHSLSRSAKASENQATVRAFMNALAQTPGFENLNADMQSLLNATLEGGKPLTAETVKIVRDSVSYDAARVAGQELVASHAIPEGHATSFAQFAMVRDMELTTPEGRRNAVQSYLCDMVIASNATHLVRQAQLSQPMTNALIAINGPLSGPEGLFATQLQADLAENGVDGAFTRLQTAFRDANMDNIAVLSQLGADLLNSLPSFSHAREIVATLKEALPTIGADKLHGLAMTAHMSDEPLVTAGDRQTEIRRFMIQQAAQGPGVQQAMIIAGLPKNFASAIANNPDVTKHIAALLHDTPGPGILPSMERVGEVTDIAVQVFVEDHLPLLREFAIMAQDAPGNLNPPVTAETMPRYINAMLAGDVILEPLLNENVVIDGQFLERVSEHAEALNSATHSFRGDYGADDISAVLRNSVAMLLARRGVTQDMLPGIMNRTVQTFGPLASHFSTLNLAVQQGLGGGNMKFLQEGMTLLRSLEGHGRVLRSLMTREQQVALGVAVPGDVDTASEEIKRADGELTLDFLETNFENLGDSEQLPLMVRDFARAHGLDIPSLSRSQRSALVQQNMDAGNAAYAAFIPENNHVVETNSAAFQAVFEDMNQNGALAGLNLDIINPRAFALLLNNALDPLVSEANEAGRPVDAAVLQQRAEAAIRTGLQELKGTLDAIGNLPADQFSEADKTTMKTLAQRYSVRDAEAIGTVFRAKTEMRESSAVGRARLEDVPGVFTSTMKEVTQTFCGFHQQYTELPGAMDLMPLLCDFILEGMTPEELGHVATNMDSNMAHKLSGACLHIMGEPGAPQNTTPLLVMPQLMNHLRQNAELRLGHNPILDPLRFTNEIQHLCELPSDSNAPLSQLNPLAPGVITDFDIRMNRHGTQLTPNQWESLRSIHQNLHSTAGNRSFMLSYWVESSASDLLAALDANHGKPLSNKQIWTAMVGGSMPRNVHPEHFGEDMLRIVSERYQKSLQTAAPDTPEPVIEAALMNNSSLGLSPKQLLALTRPHAQISLEDLSVKPDMGSLRGIDPSTAYGLETDFRRRGPNTLMTFTSLSGATLATHPFNIPDDENNPQHPHFKEILDYAQTITRSEPQLARTMQCFSQAALIMPRVLSTCFPGLQLSEHGNFSVAAQEEADGCIVVRITSDPNLPLRLNEQIRVNIDGSHTFERLDLSRP